MKIEFNLPNFDGFYHSLIDISSYLGSQYGDDMDNHIMTESDFDSIDWKATEQKVSDKYVDEWYYKNKDILDVIGVANIQFKGVDSPTYYNYTTDKCVCSAKVNKSLFKKHIKSTCKGVEFEKYIKDKYSDRSGFWSFYSNNPNEWIKDYINKLDDNCIFEGFLDFFTEELTNDEKIYDVMGSWYEFIQYKDN